MKVLLLGYGSAGQRHERNLRAIMPDVELVIYDPPQGLGLDIHVLEGSSLPDAAIIASPTAEHARHMGLCWDWSVPFYVEKPMWGGISHNHTFVFNSGERCAVGFQYRFTPAAAKLRALTETENVLRFHARDNLLARYGPDVAGIMASHAIDLALWLLGPALRVELRSDGVALTGHIQHRGGASLYDYRMDAPERESYVTVRGRRVDLPADEGMYIECLKAWLDWVQGAARDERTATLADGLNVERVLRSVTK